MAIFKKKMTLTAAKAYFHEQAHLEQSRSSAAEEYVWKEETRVAGSQIELGQKPVNRAKAEDWDDIWKKAKKGELEMIPADIRIRSYNQFRRIAVDYMKP